MLPVGNAGSFHVVVDAPVGHFGRLGLGRGGGQVTVQNTVTLWFNKRRAFCIGLVMFAGAIGGMIAQPLFAYMIKSTGKWQVGWLGAGAFTIIALIAVFFLKSKPSDYGQYPDGINPDEAQTAGAEKKAKAVAKTFRTTESWSLAEAMRTKTFWALTFAYCAISMSIYIITAHGVLHMTDKGYPMMQAAWVLSFFVLGGLVRLVIGYIGDIIEPRWLIGILLALTTASLAIFWKAPSIQALAAACFILGADYGGGLVLCSTCIGNYFSANSFAKLNTVIYPLNIGLAGLVPAVAGYIFQFTKSYDYAFIILIVICACGCLGSFLFMGPPKKSE